MCPANGVNGNKMERKKEYQSRQLNKMVNTP